MESTPCDTGEHFDPRDFRTALGTFATGVTIVTITAPDGAPIGLTCNSFSSVSLSPPLVLWSLSLRSPNLPNFLQAPHFGVNVLAADQVELARRFSQPRSNKFEGVTYRGGTGGVPLIDDAAAQLECRNEMRYYSGDHVIFIGHVLRYIWRDCAPLIFLRGQYLDATVQNNSKEEKK
jgi:3-hydroxy-9,10-secoandrosta-1,3,5(10)-triene-9,17-dione monooxygenase reductase component